MVRTRIAPSPTGEDIHIGNLYTALINWAWAKKHKGKFIIRIEDTDQERLVKGSEEKILQTIKEYGLNYDESTDIGGQYGSYRQSERLSVYKKYADELIKKKAAYYCTCTKERLAELIICIKSPCGYTQTIRTMHVTKIELINKTLSSCEQKYLLDLSNYYNRTY